MMDVGFGDSSFGRKSELAAISAAMADGVSRVFVLAGDMGVGKTHLARTALAAAAEQGRAPLWVGGSASASMVPFGAVLHLIPDVNDGDRYRLLRQTAAWLKDQPGSGTPVIVVDDAHRLDDASAALIHHVATTGAAFILATVRANYRAPEAVTSLWKDGLGRRLDMGPFDREGTLGLLKSLVAGSPDPISAARLWHSSGGNALYLCELVRAAVDSGEIRTEDGIWRWTGHLGSSSRLTELVMRRLDGQGAEIRRLVQLVAFAEPLRMATLEAVGCSAELVEFAEESGLVRSQDVNGATEVCVGHPFYAEVARSSTSPLAQTRMARILLQVARSTDHPERIIRLALWQLCSGAVPDPELLRFGALQAQAALDLVMAERLARGSVATGGGTEAALVLGRLLILRGKSAEAEELLAELMLGKISDALRAELAASRAWNLTFGLHRSEDADAVLSDAWRRGVDGRDTLAAQWANLLTYAGFPQRAISMAELVLHSTTASEAARVKALSSRCESLAVGGRTIEAVESGREACRLSSKILRGDWAMSQDEAEGALVGALIQNGNLVEAATMIETAYDRAVEAGWRVGVGMWSVWRGDLSLAKGRPATAAAQIRNGLAVVTDDRHPYLEWLMRFAWSRLAVAAALTGDATLAAAALSSADAQARPSLGALDVWGGSVHAWLAVSQYEIDRGSRLALGAAQRARRDQQWSWEIQSLHQVVRFGRPQRALARIKQLAEKLNGPILALYVEHGVALAAENIAALDRVAAAYHSQGYVLLAAEAAAQAAHAAHQQGNPAASVASRQRAMEWGAACEGARTPALWRLSEPSGLTPRETQISSLVATGQSNRQIADRLVISVRTVENILHHVYEKLAIHGRQELAAIFAPSPPRPWHE